MTRLVSSRLDSTRPDSSGPDRPDSSGPDRPDPSRFDPSRFDASRFDSAAETGILARDSLERRGTLWNKVSRAPPDSCAGIVCCPVAVRLQRGRIGGPESY
ncbi:hypothetical protein Psi02_33610 [Planotetraspora silvatica]|uniref:Uncharacterized protein n=1 Tax=Planotetraspora silvatica TaxID=234614 RepID=A0A8J3UL16_9ACTN|nr:hypothetical protein Psi02_33610 [Planotetraspora silvatica]